MKRRQDRWRTKTSSHLNTRQGSPKGHRNEAAEWAVNHRLTSKKTSLPFSEILLVLEPSKCRVHVLGGGAVIWFSCNVNFVSQIFIPLMRFRDRLKNTLKPMKWNIFHFSLDPLPPSQKWNSVLLLASFFDGKHKHEANFFWKSEIVTMKSPTPSSPPPSEKYFTSLASRYFWDGPLVWHRYVP